MQNLTTREQEIINLLTQGRDTKSRYVASVHLKVDCTQTYRQYPKETLRTQYP